MYLKIEPTPVQEIKWPGMDNTLYIKRDDLIPFSFGGNKVRIANQFLQAMEARGCDCLIAYGQSKSNLCRICANLSASMGIPCYVISALDENAAYQESFNSRMVRQFGAEIRICKKTQVAETVAALFEELRGKGKNPFYVYGDIYGKGNEALSCGAYRKAYAEIHEYMEKNGPFDALFHASATGTTQAGLIAGTVDCGDALPVIGISVARNKAAGEKAINDNLAAMDLAVNPDIIHFEDDYTAGGYGLYNEEIDQVIRTMLRENGIPLDPTYTGKAFTGMLSYLKGHDIHGKKILFLHTGGAPLFFDWLQK
ncbi:MAG: pyridoxal-phosphate dependent enzyme [Lachnospiraceae bacterium]|nr:pyridoxal-phosphate dependent enzyme [Lachnospiraceae bacterium]